MTGKKTVVILLVCNTYRAFLSLSCITVATAFAHSAERKQGWKWGVVNVKHKNTGSLLLPARPYLGESLKTSFSSLRAGRFVNVRIESDKIWERISICHHAMFKFYWHYKAH